MRSHVSTGCRRLKGRAGGSPPIHRLNGSFRGYVPARVAGLRLAGALGGIPGLVRLSFVGVVTRTGLESFDVDLDIEGK